MKPLPRWLKGKLCENLALGVLMLKGYRPLRHNWRGLFGEVDILARHGKHLHVVEVKFRKKREQAHSAISFRQLQRLTRQAQTLQRRYPDDAIQVDAMFFFSHWPYIEHHANICAG